MIIHDAVAIQIQESPKSVEQIAREMGRAASTVYRWQNPNDECLPPLNEVPLLIKVTGGNDIVGFFNLLAAPAGGPLNDCDLVSFFKTMADLADEFQRASKDRVITDAERKLIVRCGERALAWIGRIMTTAGPSQEEHQPRRIPIMEIRR